MKVSDPDRRAVIFQIDCRCRRSNLASTLSVNVVDDGSGIAFPRSPILVKEPAQSPHAEDSWAKIVCVAESFR